MNDESDKLRAIVVDPCGRVEGNFRDVTKVAGQSGRMGSPAPRNVDSRMGSGRKFKVCCRRAR